MLQSSIVKIDKRKLLLIIKLSIIVAHFLFSQGHVKHNYLNVLDSPSINSPSIKPSTLTDVSIACRFIINVPIFYPSFSGCFSNYSWVAILDDLNLLNDLIIKYMFPLFLYFFIFIVAKNINMNLNKYIDIIMVCLIPNIISRLTNRGLSGIVSEDDHMLLNVTKVLYLNVLNYTPEVSAFGPEMRQIASFLVVVIVYTTALKVYSFKVLYLFILLSFIHIYTSILILPILVALIFTKIPHRNKIAFFCASHILFCIFLQNVQIYTHHRYFLYHVLLGITLKLLESFSRSKANFSIDKPYLFRFILSIIVTYFSVQIFIIYFRHVYYLNLPKNNVLETILLYEKGSGLIERISIFLRPLIYLYLTYLISFKLKKQLLTIQGSIKQKIRFYD